MFYIDAPLGCAVQSPVKSNQQKLNNILGQIEGVKKMINNDCDCLKVLTQLKAIKAAVSGVIDGVMEEQFEKCMKSVKNEDKDLLIKMKKYVKSN